MNRLYRINKKVVACQNKKQRVEDLLLGYQYFRKKGRRKRKSIPLKKEVDAEQANTPPTSVSHSSDNCALMGQSKTVYPKEDTIPVQIEVNQSDIEMDFDITQEADIDWEAESIILERISTPVDISPTITFDDIQKLNSTLTQTYELNTDQINQAITTIELLEGTALMKDLKKRTDYESLVRKKLFKNEIIDTSKDTSAIDILFEIK